MQNTHIVLRVVEHRVFQNIDILHALILHRVGETLALYAGHIDDVGLVDSIADLGRFGKLQTLVAQELLVLLGHTQFGRRNEGKLGVEVRESLQQRVYGATVLQVANHHNVDAVECALRLFDRIEVEQCLRGVLVGTVACIDDRHLRELAGIARCTLQRVAHHDHIAVVADYLNCIVEGFTLRYTGVGCVRETDDASAEAVDRALKTESGSGRRLEKQRGDYATIEQRLVGVLLEVGSQFGNANDLIFSEIGD